VRTILLARTFSLQKTSAPSLARPLTSCLEDNGFPVAQDTYFYTHSTLEFALISISLHFKTHFTHTQTCSCPTRS